VRKDTQKIADGDLRWGILGTGQIAKKFATDLSQSKTGSLVATASRSLKTATHFADRYGGSGMEGYDALLRNPGVEAVYVSLPNRFHKEWSIKALAAGKHVLCEKPIALNARDAEDMFTAAEKSGRLLVEAFMYRAHPQTQQLFRAVRDGLIGDVKIIRANFTFSRKVSSHDARYSSGEGGGSIMDVGCYCSDFIRSLAGCEPSEVSGVIHRHECGGVDDYAVATLGFESGLLATFSCGMTVVSDQSAHIAGTTGRIEILRFWQAKEGYTVFRPSENPEIETRDRIPPIPEETRPLYAIEADAFADVVAGRVPNWNPPENSINNMGLLERVKTCAGAV